MEMNDPSIWKKPIEITKKVIKNNAEKNFLKECGEEVKNVAKEELSKVDITNNSKLFSSMLKDNDFKKITTLSSESSSELYRDFNKFLKKGEVSLATGAEKIEKLAIEILDSGTNPWRKLEAKKEMKALLTEIVETHPEYNYKQVSDAFGTSSIVYDGPDSSLDGLGRVLLKQRIVNSK